jgi:RNA polymerase sigma-70 factor (ECF subfamily)
MFPADGKNLVWSSPGANGQNWSGVTKPAPLFPAASDVSDAVVVAPQISVATRPTLYMARASDAASRNGAAPGGEAGSTPDPDEAPDGETLDNEDEVELESEAEEEPRVSAKDAAKAAFLKVLQRAKEGDRKAFEEIYQLYHRRIYNAVYGMLSDADDAQDVTQDVFIRLHDALPTLRADEAFSTYLYRIALNLCRDRARRKKRVRFQSMDTPRAGEEGDIEPMEFPDAGKLPEELLTGDELQTRVREAVQTLSEDHKAVIMMHHFQGMEVNDIASILDVPSGTVKSRLARGRDQLHRKLKTYLNV